MPNPPPKEDTWAFQPIGAPLLPSPVKCMGEKNMYVALWCKNGKPIHGRSWNNGGVVECSFPYEEAEWTTKAQLEGQIQVLQYVGDHNNQGFWYEWIKYKDRIEKIDDKHQLVRCGDSFPVFWKRPEGNLLGYVDNKTEDAWFSFNGKVIKQTGPQLNDMYIITRNCVGGPPHCECAGSGGQPREDVSSVELEKWLDMREGEGEYEGGKFEKWPLLIEDCRREVVKHLDYKTRCNLQICSKDDHGTVEATKIHVESVEIHDNKWHNWIYEESGEIFDKVTVRIQFPTVCPMEWTFSQLGQHTRVKWRQIWEQRAVKEVIWESCNYYDAAVKFAEKWIKKCNFELEEVIVKMEKYPFPTSQIKSLACCKKVTIWENSVNHFNWWLEKCPEKLDYLSLGVRCEDEESFTLPSCFLNRPQVMHASDLKIWCRAAFSDDQLLKLKAKSMHFKSVDFTDERINKFIRNWTYGKAVDGFEDVYFWDEIYRDPDVLLKGLDEVKEWDEEFVNEQRKFAEDFKKSFTDGQYYQIGSKVRPFESITMVIDDMFIAIHVTGRRVERNGKASTHYRVPDEMIENLSLEGYDDEEDDED